jgi:hypothetical protein
MHFLNINTKIHFFLIFIYGGSFLNTICSCSTLPAYKFLLPTELWVGFPPKHCSHSPFFIFFSSRMAIIINKTRFSKQLFTLQKIINYCCKSHFSYIFFIHPFCIMFNNFFKTIYFYKPCSYFLV